MTILGSLFSAETLEMDMKYSLFVGWTITCAVSCGHFGLEKWVPNDVSDF